MKQSRGSQKKTGRRKDKDGIRWKMDHIGNKFFFDVVTTRAKRPKIHIYWFEDSLILAKPQLQQKGNATY